MKLSINQYAEIVGKDSKLNNVTDWTKTNSLSNARPLIQKLTGHYTFDNTSSSTAYKTISDIYIPAEYVFRGNKILVNIKISNTSSATGSPYYMYQSYDTTQHNLINTNIPIIFGTSTPYKSQEYVAVAIPANTKVDFDYVAYEYFYIDNLVANAEARVYTDVTKKGDNYHIIAHCNGSDYLGLSKFISNSNFAYGDYKVNFNIVGVDLDYIYGIQVQNETKSSYITLEEKEPFTFTLTPANYSSGDKINIYFLINRNAVGDELEFDLNNYYIVKIDDKYKWSYVDLGSLNPQISGGSGSHIFYYEQNFKDMKNFARVSYYCNGYKSKYPTHTAETEDKTVGLFSDGSVNLYINDTSFIGLDATQIKAAMSGVILMYENNWKTVDLGTLSWVDDGDNVYYATLSDIIPRVPNDANILHCKLYKTNTSGTVGEMSDMSISTHSYLTNIFVKDSSVLTVDDLKRKLQGIILHYQSTN